MIDLIYYMLNSAFNNIYILRNYYENILFFRALTSRARAEHTKSSARARFLNEHIYVFELEFLTNRVEPSFYRAELELVREQLCSLTALLKYKLS